MIQPTKYQAVNYPLSTILLILGAAYLYFLSPFSGIVFYPVFFLVLAVISFSHTYALIIDDKNIIYRPFPIFSRKIIEISEITEIKVESAKVLLFTEKRTVSIKRYFLKNDQWSNITHSLKSLSKISDPS